MNFRIGRCLARFRSGGSAFRIPVPVGGVDSAERPLIRCRKVDTVSVRFRLQQRPRSRVALALLREQGRHLGGRRTVMKRVSEESRAYLESDVRFPGRFGLMDNLFRRSCRAFFGSRGFTVVELFVILAIAAILLTVVAPSLRTFVHANELIGATNHLVGQLSLARSEALERRTDIVVCKSGGGATCVSTGTWETGWIIFADGDGNGSLTAGDELFHAHTPVVGSTKISASSGKVVFDRHGETGAPSSFTFCSAMINKGRTISVNRLGRYIVIPAGC